MLITTYQNKRETLFYLLILTSFFMLLEFSYFLQINSAYLADYTFVSKNLDIPFTILPGILYFIFSQFLVHACYCLGLWMIIELICSLIKPKAKYKIHFILGIWILSVVTILTANQYFFPNSRFAELTSFLLINQSLAKIFFLLFSAICSLLILLAAIGLLKLFHQRLFFISVLLLLLIASGIFLFKSHSQNSNPAATASRPNIILIGIDSLRPDFLSYFGYEKQTPFLDSLLEESTVFAEAITPLARTFPSWSSLLMGQYPREIHIRSNLADQQKLELQDSLPAILKQHGYETIYATDETRFSNIDKNFGFDRIIGPGMGLNDFLIGNFNDFPLSNLLVNTALGKWLFPHSYANRPVYFTYDPNSFNRLLKPLLEEKRTRPLFLATHFCLPHAPYLWGGQAGLALSAQERYEASIGRVDSQIRDFFAILLTNHLLDHAIVVLLSDHGEALEFSGDRITEKDLFVSRNKAMAPRFYPPALDAEEFNQSAGHGTDVLGLPQYHTLLAFSLHGLGEYQKNIIPGVVSLIDIKPTLLEFLNIPAGKSSGLSLLKILEGEKNQSALQARHVFLESDYSPVAIRTVYPEVRKVMLEGIEIFRINPETMRLTVRNEMSSKIIASKQYADIHDEWMLALYPQNANYRMAILINLNSGKWTNDLESDFAIKSPAKKMLAKLRAFYGDEIQVQDNPEFG